MPSGIDIMSSLGSNTADNMISDLNYNSFCNYSNQLEKSKDLVSSYTINNWTNNLYNSWLWLLQPVISNKPYGYPNWMRSNEWKHKEIITSLGSWVQLRHDTILYIKQSYTARTSNLESTSYVKESRYYGYVEPNPEFYFRASKIMQLLKDGLEEKELLSSDLLSDAIDESIIMMNRLEEISKKELENEDLSEADYYYIEGINNKFSSILKKLASALVIDDGKSALNKRAITSLATKDDPFNTQIIADVHTEGNTSKVLEVGTGKIDWVVVAHKSKDGSIGLAVGPIFSYYEFPWNMADRLTDEKWRSKEQDIQNMVDKSNKLYK
jgi:hypothetical protein